MNSVVTKTNKTIINLSRPKGQGLVEFVLILAFCAAIGVAAREAGFGKAIDALIGSGEQPEYVAAAIGGPKKQIYTYVVALAKYGSKGRRALVNLVDAGNGKYTLGEDIIPNAERVAADRVALENIADLFLGMDYKTLKTDVFRNELQDNWFTNGGPKGDGILILNYSDRASVESDYDSSSGAYKDDAHTKIVLEETGRRFDKKEVIHWMQGDYGSYKDSNASYDSSKDFDSSTRYFYSNEMIGMEQYGLQWGNGERRNIRVRFIVSGTSADSIVTGVEVRLQHNGKDYDNLKITKTAN